MANRLLYISRALTEGKQRWPAINCAVEKLPGPLVSSPVIATLPGITVHKSFATVIPYLFRVSVVAIFVTPLSVFATDHCHPVHRLHCDHRGRRVIAVDMAPQKKRPTALKMLMRPNIRALETADDWVKSSRMTMALAMTVMP